MTKTTRPTIRQTSTSSRPAPLLLTEDEAGRYLGFSGRTLQKWRWTGRGPSFVRISPRCVRYRRRDLDAWVEEQLRTSTTDRSSGSEGC